MRGEKLEVTRGSGNVFRDLRRKNADAEQFKAILAAEIIIRGGIGLGHALTKAGSHFDAASILALMVVVFVIGVVIDYGFAVLDRRVRSRRGMVAVS